MISETAETVNTSPRIQPSPDGALVPVAIASSDAAAVAAAVARGEAARLSDEERAELEREAEYIRQQLQDADALHDGALTHFRLTKRPHYWLKARDYARMIDAYLR